MCYSATRGLIVDDVKREEELASPALLAVSLFHTRAVLEGAAGCSQYLVRLRK